MNCDDDENEYKNEIISSKLIKKFNYKREMKVVFISGLFWVSYLPFLFIFLL